MWHRAGGLVVLANDMEALRVQDQDWSELVLDAHPHAGAGATHRQVRTRGTSACTDISMTTAANGTVSLAIAVAADVKARGWVLRLHLRPGQQASYARVDNEEARVVHIAPTSAAAAARFFPFGGKDAAPAPAAGHVAQIVLPSSRGARTVVVHLT